MNKRTRQFTFTSCLLSLCFVLSSQNTRTILLEDLSESDLSVKCYCKPGLQKKSRPKGLHFFYNLVGPGNLESDQIDLNPRFTKFRKTRISLTLPLLRKEKDRLFISYAYHAEQYEFSEIANDFKGLFTQLDNRNFKGNSLKISYARSLNSKNYIGIGLTNSFNGDYNGWMDLSSRYHVLTGALAYGIKKDQDNEWGFGLAFSRSFRNRQLRFLPFVFWYKNFNNDWGIESTLPSKFYLRHNYNKETILLLGFNFNGESYSFDQNDIQNRLTFNHNEIQFLLKMEKKIVDWVWMDFATGYQHNFDTTFENQTLKTDLLSVKPGGSAYVRIGIFISPPDRILNKK